MLNFLDKNLWWDGQSPIPPCPDDQRIYLGIYMMSLLHHGRVYPQYILDTFRFIDSYIPQMLHNELKFYEYCVTFLTKNMTENNINYFLSEKINVIFSCKDFIITSLMNDDISIEKIHIHLLDKRSSKNDIDFILFMKALFNKTQTKKYDLEKYRNNSSVIGESIIEYDKGYYPSPENNLALDPTLMHIILSNSTQKDIEYLNSLKR